MKRLYTILLLFIPVFSFAVNRLYNSIAQSPYSFYYKISNEEAAELFSSPKAEKIYGLLHTKADSILTVLNVDPPLAQGHYIKVRTVGPQVKADVITVQHFYSYILNNHIFF